MTSITGVGQLVRLILRRDRFLLPIWVLLLALLPVTYASATEQLYPTPQGLAQYYQSIVSNPSLMSTLGPVFGDTLGALTTWRSGILLLFLGIISLLTVIRHTRTEEEAGRRELLGSTVLGRQAPLAAALIVTGGANVVLGLVLALGMIGYGLPAAGSLALGLAFTTTGLLFAAVGALAAQLTEGAGASRGIGLATVGAIFLIRTLGDAGGLDGRLAWLSWLSPIGWAHRVRPYAGERWWLLLLLVALSAALVATAVRVQSQRDIGAGVLPPRLGPAYAAPGLRSPLGLAWRLQRGSLLGWCVGFIAIGAMVGGATKSIDLMAGDNAELGDLLARIGGTTVLQDAYVAATLGLLALAAAGYSVAAVLRLRAEETSLRAEPLLATPVSRTAWAVSHILFAVLGPALGVLLLGLTIGLVSGSGDPARQVGRVLSGAVLQLPAVWVLTGLTVALFGLLPRLAAALAWGALAACVLLSFVGQLLQLDQRILDVSPFLHTPRLPGGEVTATPLAWLLGIAVVLTAAGLLGFRRRDLSSSA